MVPGKFYHNFFLSIVLLLSGYSGLAAAQNTAHEQDQKPSSLPYFTEATVTNVTRYIWRGQRLTDDWSLQPSMTLGRGNFSFNVWGNMDLTAVNEGDALFLPQNPLAPPGDHNGLKGKFSEVDYTFSYNVPLKDYTITTGAIFYTFPDRSASLPATTEIFGGIQFDAVPLTPFATLYVDVDETGDAGKTGIYLEAGASHFIPFPWPRLHGLEVSGSLGFVNSGFSHFYYGNDRLNGLNDVNLTFSSPIVVGEHWTLETFISYSALIGEFRQHQFRNPRQVLRGTAGSPSTFADTLWGGVSIKTSF